MPYKLLPLPLSEVSMYYRICREAFIPGILEAMYPNGYSDAATEIATELMKRKVGRHPERQQLFKIVDDALPDSDAFDKVVGISQWQIYPRERSAEEMQAEKAQRERDDEEVGPPPGLHKQVLEDFVRSIGGKKEKFLGGRAHVCLAVLGTRPDYQRKGVGSVSMAWGTRKADEMGLPMWLEGSEKGVELYKKWGFEVVDKVDWDARNYGYKDSLAHVCMLRPAVNQTATTS